MQAAPVYPREYAIAEEILEAIPSEVAFDGEDGGTLRFRLRRKLGWRLGTVIFCRKSLRKLANDVQRDVKIEYLRRDLEYALTRRATYSYPRGVR